MSTSVVMSEVKRISESEWKVMEVVWEGFPVTAQDVVAALGEVEEWKPQTVKTLLGRLVKKGALRAEAEGNRFLYFPIVERKEAVMAETDSFLERISRGSLTPMLAQMVKSRRKLSEEEIDALRDLLDGNETKKGEEQ
ncbi:MAG: BlaI/MecI/CopY family transcriptional regulator [Luteolibacter sp.]